MREELSPARVLPNGNELEQRSKSLFSKKQGQKEDMEKRQYQAPKIKVVVPPELMLSIGEGSAIEVLSKENESWDDNETGQTALPEGHSVWED